MPMPLNPRSADPSVGENAGKPASRCSQTTPAGPSGRTPSVDPSPPIKIVARPALTRTLDRLILAAAAMAALLCLLSPAGHDQLWFLLMADRWRHGVALYGPALFDSNPPLIVWLSAIPLALAAAAHTVGIHLVPALTAHLPSSSLQALRAATTLLQPLSAATLWAKLLVLLALTLTAALSLPPLRRLVPRLDSATHRWLLFAFLTLAAVIPARDFGQRDHLAGLLCLPYILAAATTLLRTPLPSSVASAPILHPPLARTLRLSIALLAALGLALKPQQVLLVIAVELTRLLLWLRTSRHPAPSAHQHAVAASPDSTLNPAVSSHPGRTHTTSHPAHAGRTPIPLFRLEPAVLLLTGLLYLVLIRQLTPAYVTVALPLLHQTYWAIAHLNTLALLREAPQLDLLALTTVALVLWQQSHPVPRSSASQITHTSLQVIASQPQRIAGPHLNPAILLLLAAGVGATLAYHLQATGWYYQQLPALTCFGAALALALLDPLSRLADLPRRLPALAACLSTVAVVLTAFFLRDLLLPGRPIVTSPDPAFFAALPPGTPVAILTTSVEDSMMPIAEHHLLWAQRTNNLWLLPAVLRLEDPHPTPLARSHALTPAQLTALDTRQHRAMLEDLTRWRPTLILVERCQDLRVHCQELEDRHDDLLAWLIRDLALRSLWQRYRPGPTLGDYDSWILR